VKRSKPLRANLEQIQAWQRKSQQTALARAKAKPRRFAKRVARRRNDGPWRREVMEVRGPQCRVTGCGRMLDLHAHHIIHRSMCGPSIVQNGMPLCEEHHAMVHAYELRISPEWLDADQIEWLSDEGHAEWLFDGVVVGRHLKLFADGPDRRGPDWKVTR
jgi:hypothetical protein